MRYIVLREAAQLIEVGRGYTDEEAREHLLWMFRPVPNRAALKPTEPAWISGGVRECIATAEQIAAPDFDTASYAQRHKAWLATKTDCTAFLTWFIENYPASAKETKKGGAEFWKRFK